MRGSHRKGLSRTAAAAGLTVALAVVGARASAIGPDRPDGGSLRVYDGAPPVIPHAVEALGRQKCVNCHSGRGLVLADGRRARPSPHSPDVIACRQCHVEQRPDAGPMVRGTSTPYKGLQPRPRHVRVNPAGPPIIPHRLLLRENCLACHGRAGEPEIQTRHPDRQQCVMCHVPQSEGWPWATGEYERGK